MGRLVGGLAAAGAVCAVLLLTGCGGSQLKPNEQKEYDRLKAEQASINKQIGAANAAADKAFRDAGAAEKSKRSVFKQGVLCGGSASGQKFGPLPFSGKKSVSLSDAGSKTVSGQKCDAFNVRVK